MTRLLADDTPQQRMDRAYCAVVVQLTFAGVPFEEVYPHGTGDVLRRCWFLTVHGPLGHDYLVWGRDLDPDTVHVVAMAGRWWTWLARDGRNAGWRGPGQAKLVLAQLREWLAADEAQKARAA